MEFCDHIDRLEVADFIRFPIWHATRKRVGGWMTASRATSFKRLRQAGNPAESGEDGNRCLDWDITRVTVTASTQSGICAVVSGDLWDDDDGNRDVAVTAYPEAATTRRASTAKGLDAMCGSASHVHATKNP